MLPLSLRDREGPNKAEGSTSLIDHFAEIVDPRIERDRKHNLLDMIVLTVCAVRSGSETWEDIEDYWRYKQQWLSRFLPLPNGIPSHDTIRRLFIRLDPGELQRCFLSWVEAVRGQTEGDVVAIDGKTLRRSGEHASGSSPFHMVSAWAAADGLVLGQKRTEAHSNEITAIPALVELLKIKGCVVTIDAEGLQGEITEKIIAKKADYVTALKANQPTMYEEVKYYFSDLDGEDVNDQWVTTHRTVDKGHGRIEIREYYHCDVVAWMPELAAFAGLLHRDGEGNPRNSRLPLHRTPLLPLKSAHGCHALCPCSTHSLER